MAKTIVYTSSGTFTVPADWSNTGAYIEVLDAGNPATRDGDNGFIYGGAGGEYRKYTSLSFTAGQSKTVTVGAPGSVTSSMTGASSLALSYTGGTGATDGDSATIRGWGGGAAGPSAAGSAASNSAPGSAGAGSWTSNATATGSASAGTYSPGAGDSGGYGAGAHGSYDSEGAGLSSSGQGSGLVVITYTPVVGGVTLTTTTSIFSDNLTAPAEGVTLLWMDGFDGYSSFSDITNEYVYNGFSTNAVMDTTAGRFGGYCVKLGNGFGGLRRQLGTSFTKAWMGFAHRRDRVGGGDDRVAQWYSGQTGTIELTLTHNNVLGILKVWRGDCATLLATATRRIPSPQTLYHFYEWFVTFDGSAGTTEVWVDGVPYIQATGLNTKQTAATALTGFGIGTPGVDAVWMMYDDLYVTVGQRLGDFRVVTRVPTSDASPNAGTPSTGTTHWGVVDENPINYTDYVTLVNVNLTEELFGLSTFPAAAVTVRGVRVIATGRKNAAVNSYNITVVAKSGSTYGESDPVGLSYNTTWAGISKLFATDPATGAGWTTSAASAMKAGVRVRV